MLIIVVNKLIGNICNFALHVFLAEQIVALYVYSN
jgi:hypothetical protein